MRFAFIAVAIILLAPAAMACKDVIVMNEGTAGDYTLFMKIRDPSRPGLQVLFMVDKGYEYTYHHPWKGYNIPYTIKHKLIGVATIDDVPPNIIKAGMLMSDAGIAYGDADSPTLWVNPSRYAWDDFDWLRYAAQNASSVDEAVEKLEEVKNMHAPGIGENLFVVSADKAYVIEADAFHFVSEEVKDIAVMSNYPKQLWYSRWLKKIFIASNFDRVYEGNVRKWQTVRLGSLCGIKVLKIGEDWILVKQMPGGEKIKIEKGRGAKVGYYYVELEESDGKTARIKVCYEYYAWENKILEKLRQKYGAITVRDLMNLSRLHSEDLNGLRGLCEGEKKATMIFKLCRNGIYAAWFAPDQCVSIFVPVHMCDTTIYEAYKNGEAAELALTLLTKFGHDGVNFGSIESVFIKENERMETLAAQHREKKAEILTSVDTEMQRQAIIMEKLYLNADSEERELIKRLWQQDYHETLSNIYRNINRFDDYGKEMLASIALSIAKIRVDVEAAVNGSDLRKEYSKAEILFQKGKYKDAVGVAKEIYEKSDEKLFGIKYEEEKSNEEQIVLAGAAIIFITIILILMKKPKTKE